VKHSAIEPEPEVAAALCGDGIQRVRRYALELGSRGEELGLIGPDEAPRLWTRHLLNCALVGPELPSSNNPAERISIADVGSGAGLPGLVLAMIRPDLNVTLIEPLERRTRWLIEMVEHLELTNVTVFTGRAEEFRPRGAFELVTARAVKALKGLLPILEPLVKPGGSIMLLKGQRIDDEIAEANDVIRRLKLTSVSSRVLGEGIVDEPTRLFTAKVE
jgi:16S rRNA (guanine527-N7)-methyltransferase